MVAAEGEVKSWSENAREGWPHECSRSEIEESKDCKRVIIRSVGCVVVDKGVL